MRRHPRATDRPRRTSRLGRLFGRSIVYDELARPRPTFGELALLWAEAHGVEAVSEPVERDVLPRMDDRPRGQALLAANGQDWSLVHGGRGGAVEVAVARNAYAHAAHLVDAKAEARLAAAGSARWTAGARVELQVTDVIEFRTRIWSLLRYGGFH